MSRPVLVPIGTLEQSSPATPAAGTVLVYSKSDHKLYIKDSTGVETDLTATGVSTPVARAFAYFIS